MASTQRIKVFISSPGDVRDKEGAVVLSVLDELNANDLKGKGCVLETYEWKNRSPPICGERPQQSVDKYMLQAGKSDIFICIFWRRMGTPTQDQRTGHFYPSGTAYEFHAAYRAHRRRHARRRPVILLYRSTKPGPPLQNKDEERQQAERVDEFFKAMRQPDSPYDGLPREVGSVEEFRTVLLQDLRAVLRTDFARKGAKSESILGRIRSNLRLANPLRPVEESEIREKLLDKVEQDWVDDFLENSPDRSPPFRIPIRIGSPPGEPAAAGPGRADSGGSTANVSGVSSADGGAGIDEDFSLAEEFAKAKRQLLILGSSGSGKTFVLASLVRDLIEEARCDERERIPVVFNLSSWASRQEELGAWMISELVKVYRMPGRFAQYLVANEKLIFCLDGLDEITFGEDIGNREQMAKQRELRTACLRAIGEFFRPHPGAEIVLCCGSAQYKELVPDGSGLLKFPKGGRTLHLEPLNAEQIDRFLAADVDLQMLEKAVKRDSTLRQMVTTPYVLKLMIGTYRDNNRVGKQELLESKDEESRLSDLYTNYVRSCWDELGQGARYSMEDVRKFLHWLACVMDCPKFGSKLLLVEYMQPGWLEAGGRRRWLFHTALLFFIFAAVTIGVPVGLGIGFEWIGEIGVRKGLENALRIGLVTASLVGMVGAGGFIFTRRWLFGGVLGLAFGVARACTVGLSVPRLQGGWRLGLIHGVVTTAVAAPLLGYLFLVGDYRREVIRPLEPLSWNWGRAFFGALAGIPVGIAFGLFDPGRGVGFGTMAAVVLMLGAGFSGTGFEARVRPNQGIVQSAETAALWGVCITLFGVVCIGLCYGMITFKYAGPKDAVREGFVNALLALGISASTLFFGAIPVLKHAGLRFTLWRENLAPLPLVDFLNNIVSQSLLRRHGGGYKFLHERMRQYFAKLGE